MRGPSFEPGLTSWVYVIDNNLANLSEPQFPQLYIGNDNTIWQGCDNTQSVMPDTQRTCEQQSCFSSLLIWDRNLVGIRAQFLELSKKFLFQPCVTFSNSFLTQISSGLFPPQFLSLYIFLWAYAEEALWSLETKTLIKRKPQYRVSPKKRQQEKKGINCLTCVLNRGWGQSREESWQRDRVQNFPWPRTRGLC